MKERFQEWLLEKGYALAVAKNGYPSGINHLSRDLGEDIFQITDLDRVGKIKRLYGVSGAKRSVGDHNNGAPRAAIIQYEKFIRELSGTDEFPEPGEESNSSASVATATQLTYERDLHNALERQLPELFPGYELVGSEYTVENVRLDLLLKKGNNFLVVELKAGTATHAAFGQISMYMGLVAAQFSGHSVEGVIIAHDIDPGLIAACSISDKISCKRYKMKLSLEGV